MNKLLNLEEASTYIGRTKETLRKAIINKEIPCRKFRGAYVFSQIALEIWASGINVEEIENTLRKEFDKSIISNIKMGI